ncbi:MAG: chromate transporter, partial [Clostridia bacterium]|nr:chromate transporter [Clostridia bacterium]
MIILELLTGFLAIGCLSFGGAYGAIPLIREVVISYGWMEEEKLSYLIAVSESTPGPIMVNLATYIGSEKAGVSGAAVATLSVILPAFLIVIVLTVLLKKLVKNAAFQSVLGALKACVTGIVLATGVYMILQNCAGSPVDITAVI